MIKTQKKLKNTIHTLTKLGFKKCVKHELKAD